MLTQFIFMIKISFILTKKANFCVMQFETKFERILPFLNNNSDYMTFFNNKLLIAYCYSNFLAILDLD